MSGLGGFGTMLYDKYVSPPDDPTASFQGRTIIVTGANVGVGFEAALKFVEKGADKVILGVRSLKKGEDARVEIEKRTGKKGNVDVWLVDMGDYDSVKAFAKRADELDKLDIAVLNAGIIQIEYNQGNYGWENTLQVNTISTTLLSLLLLPKLKASKTASFTPVLELISSSNHTRVAVKDEARNSANPLKYFNGRKPHDGLMQYSISKLFLMNVQDALVRELGPIDKSNVEIVTTCPGACQSSLAGRYDLAIWMVALNKIMWHVFMKPAEQGARIYVAGAAQGGKAHGKFFTGKIVERAPNLVGSDNEKMGVKVWQGVVEALHKDVPDVDNLLAAAKAAKN